MSAIFPRNEHTVERVVRVVLGISTCSIDKRTTPQHPTGT